MGTRVRHDEMAQPEPDEAQLDGTTPGPQPERREPRVDDPGLRDLTFADWKAIVIRAGKRFLADNATMLASALAYSTFFAIPSVLLVVVGLFTLIAGPDTITTLMQHFNTFMPARTLAGGRANSHGTRSGTSHVPTATSFADMSIVVGLAVARSSERR